MFKKCPRCGSYNVRRSSVRASRSSPPPILRSPYRCRDCGERFLVIGRNVHLLAAGLGGMILAFAIWVGVLREPDYRSSPAESSNAVASKVRSTIAAAERGDPAAEHELAQMYATGDGVPQDERKATAWLERAAAHGEAEAQYQLGIALRDGRGTLQDDDRAFKMMQQAAGVGNVYAQYELGRMYLVGIGTRVDKVKAYTWLNVAASQGVAEAVMLRDIVRGQLAAEDVGKAQSDARRLTEGQPSPVTKAP
jgi:TPR repeat protein